MNQFIFIHKIFYGYQKSKLHDQNDEINNLSVFLRLSMKDTFKNKRHLSVKL